MTNDGIIDRDEVLKMAKLAGFIGNVGIAVKEFEAFAKLVDAKATAKERDRMCEQCKWSKYENATCNEANQSKILGEG